MAFNLADLLESVTAVARDREAVVVPATGGEPAVRLTHGELDERADRLAHVLAGLGVGRDDAVGVALRNGNEALEALLACFKLRAVPVNVSTRAVAAEVAAVLDDCEAVAVLCEPDLPAVVEAAGARPTLARGPAWEAALAEAPAGRVDVGARSGDDRYLLYTGGTTGRPKGVLWRHEDLFFAALGGGEPGGDPVATEAAVAEAARSSRNRCLPASTLQHGTGQWMALTTLLGGGTVVLLRGDGVDADRLLAAVVAESVTFLVVVGDAFARPLVDALERLPDREALSSLGVVLSGGAVLSPSTTADLVRLLPWIVVVDGFGSTETGGQGQRVTWPGGGPGAPAPSFALRDDTEVVDGDLHPLPPGEVGWLARRGRLPVGYLGDDEATSRTFRTGPGGVRWAVPGDRAVREHDGTIRVLGRGASVVRTGGEEVHVEEVEAVVRSHRAVADAVVVGTPDPRWGEVVTAVAALRHGATLDVDALRDHCREVLSPAKLPRRLVVVDRVERAASGKPDLRWAREVATG